MDLLYDREALLEFMDASATITTALKRRYEDAAAQFQAVRTTYSRLSGEAEEQLRRTQNAVAAAVHELDTVSAEQKRIRERLTRADGEDRLVLENRLRTVQNQENAAEAAFAAASEKQKKAEVALKKLEAVWSLHNPTAEAALYRAEDSLSAFDLLLKKSNADLAEFIRGIEKGRETLYGASADEPRSGAVFHARQTSAAAPGQKQRRPAGWCEGDGFIAVSVGADGQKTVSIDCQGNKKTFSCDKNGIAKAYRDARKCGDQEAAERAYAMFEIETLREELELTEGDPDTVQLGGYHREVEKQDPSGYESHHIPARSVQDANAAWLPAVSITEEDHKNTSSYAGKQRRLLRPVFPDGMAPASYKKAVTDKVAEGGSGYVQAVRDELLDLRAATGHKYDGGISAYLDTVIDMIATQGIPDKKP